MYNFFQKVIPIICFSSKMPCLCVQPLSCLIHDKYVNKTARIVVSMVEADNRLPSQMGCQNHFSICSMKPCVHHASHECEVYRVFTITFESVFALL